MEKDTSFEQRYFLHKILKTFVREGHDALTKEMDQLYRRTYFETIYIRYLETKEKRRSQEDKIILNKNITTKKTEGRMVSNVKPTRQWLSREDTSSPTASLQAICLWQQLMRMRDEILWFWVFQTHSFRPTCNQINMVKKGES